MRRLLVKILGKHQLGLSQVKVKVMGGVIKSENLNGDADQIDVTK
jgi:hypothetical protein